MSDIRELLTSEERDGQHLALKGRLIALGVISVLLIFVTPYPGLLYYHGLIAVFLLIGVGGYYSQQQSWYRPWHQYIFIFADFALLSFTVTYPNPIAAFEYPPQIGYRFGNVIYLYVLLIGLAFSYRPKFVVWGGLAGAVCWGIGLLWMVSLPDTVSQLNVSDDELLADPWKYINDPKFVDLGVRLQEVVVFLVSAGLIATIVHRSRRLVLRQVTAERERQFVREALGKYVPASVANAIIEDRGALEPQRRTATMLFTDIKGFTAMVEQMDPAAVMTMLNDYFAAVGEVIVAEGGVINQFQGDAILATFNVPVPDEDHAAAAIRAARQIHETVENRSFAGHTVRSRIGIATGEVMAGSVGSGSQSAYTVHGDAVNLAARLEQMNKETGTTILIAGPTVEACRDPIEAKMVGEIPIRGHSAELVYTL